MARPQFNRPMKQIFYFLIDRKIICCYLLFACVSCTTPKTQNSNCLRAIERLPGNSIYAPTYRCKDMVQCINTLQEAGKCIALQALQQQELNNSVNGDPLQDQKLIYLCHLLFVNSNGWAQLGGEPKTDKRVAKSFPSFPIAISDGVPFLLIDGRIIDGLPSVSGAGEVRKCSGLQTIDHGLPVRGFKNAARDLIQSESFQRLYLDPRDTSRMAEEIWNQAN